MNCVPQQVTDQCTGNHALLRLSSASHVRRSTGHVHVNTLYHRSRPRARPRIVFVYLKGW